MENKQTWIITEENKNKFMETLTNELVILRTKTGLTQDEIASLIGISRQTYGDIERKKRKMSWNIYLCLILFFDYNKETHNMLRVISVFPTNLINQFNEYKKNNNLNLNEIIGIPPDDLNNKLDDRALHAIKTVIMLEYLRCSKLPNDKVIKVFDNLNFLTKYLVDN